MKTIDVRPGVSAMKPLKIQWYSRITSLNMRRGKPSGTDESFVLHRQERSLIKYVLHYHFFFLSHTHIICRMIKYREEDFSCFKVLCSYMWVFQQVLVILFCSEVRNCVRKSQFPVRALHSDTIIGVISPRRFNWLNGKKEEDGK